MSKFKNRLLLLTTLLLVSVPLMFPALGIQLEQSSDEIVEIKTEDASDLFDYKGSTLGGTVKATVYCRNLANSPDVKYEELWFHGWGAIGCRRFAELSVDQNRPISIRLSPGKSSSETQIQACGNAVLRVLLDLYAQGTSVSYIVVPDDQFVLTLTNELRRAGLNPLDSAVPDQMTECGLTVVLKAESSGRLYTLYQEARD